MTRNFAAFAILITTTLFTVIGVAVGYLISTGNHASAQQGRDDTVTLFATYASCTTGGFVAGLVLSAFAVWLVGIAKRD